MKKFNHNRAFTLIEIIVVLIIIGILAAIALPNLFANTTRSKAAAAIAEMDAIKSQIETCVYQNNVSPCTSASDSNCNPNLCYMQNSWGVPLLCSGEVSASAPFCFEIAEAGNSPQGPTSGTIISKSGLPSSGNLTYTIVADDESLSGNAGYYITLVRSTDGTFTCSAPTSGPYVGVC